MYMQSASIGRVLNLLPAGLPGSSRAVAEFVFIQLAGHFPRHMVGKISGKTARKKPGRHLPRRQGRHEFANSRSDSFVATPRTRWALGPCQAR